MSRRTLFASLTVLAIAAFVAVGIWGPDRSWDRDNRQVEVVQLVDDQGNAVEGASTVIIDRDRHGPPFGFLFFPLGILLVVGAVFAIRGGPGRRGPCGPGGVGGPHQAQWLDEWHRRQHEHTPETSPPTTSAPTASS